MMHTAAALTWRMFPMADTSELARLRSELRFTQNQMAEKLGVTDTRYKNWEYGRAPTPADVLRKAKRLLLTDTPGQDVGVPRGPISESEVLVPHIGKVAASSPVSWRNPLESPLDWPVPVHMLRFKGTFTAEVERDSMMPFLEPSDICVFVNLAEDEYPKLNRVVLFMSDTGDGDCVVAIKQWKHDGERFYLHSINPAYERVYPTAGRPIAVMKGLIRKTENGDTITRFNEDDLVPR